MKKPVKQPVKLGRPTSYRPAMCARVVELGRQGCSKAELASDLDVTRETLDVWMREHSAFSDAVQRAREHSFAWWEAKARTNLGTAGFQANLWSKSMSGRFPGEPYRDRLELSGPDGAALVSRVELVAPVMDAFGKAIPDPA